MTFINKDMFRIMTKHLLVRNICCVVFIIGIFIIVISKFGKLVLPKRSVGFPLPLHYKTKDGHFDFRKSMNVLNKARVPDTDSKLITLIRNHYIENPSTLPYQLDKPEHLDPPEHQVAVIDKLLNKKEGGFYVDCGANDGEEFSNTLFLERRRNWNGILIEANPTVYKKLKKKNRKSFTLNACLNTKPFPSLATFLEDSWWGKIIEGTYSKSYRGIGGKGRFVQVQCFPLYSILLALNQTGVDYFSLDVEGSEKGVLDTIPWEKLDIKTMSIEYDKWPGGNLALISYMEQRGYKAVREIKATAAADVIFIKN